MLIPPYCASELGRRNTPDPIMLPTTSAVAIHRPSFRPLGRARDLGPLPVPPDLTPRTNHRSSFISAPRVAFIVRPERLTP
jgi:hypothetical protein